MSSQDLQNLKKAREKLRLTQAQVAEKVGISTNHYAKIERGEVDPSLPTLRAIFKLLKIDIPI